MGLIIYVDYSDPALREEPTTPTRFHIAEFDSGMGDTLLMTNDWDAVLALVAKRREEKKIG